MYRLHVYGVINPEVAGWFSYLEQLFYFLIEDFLKILPIVFEGHTNKDFQVSFKDVNLDKPILRCTCNILGTKRRGLSPPNFCWRWGRC